jgi:hypothetical protein
MNQNLAQAGAASLAAVWNALWQTLNAQIVEAVFYDLVGTSLPQVQCKRSLSNLRKTSRRGLRAIPRLNVSAHSVASLYRLAKVRVCHHADRKDGSRSIASLGFASQTYPYREVAEVWLPHLAKQRGMMERKPRAET